MIGNRVFFILLQNIFELPIVIKIVQYVTYITQLHNCPYCKRVTQNKQQLTT